MRLYTERAFRRAVEAAKQTDRPASEVLMLYSKNPKLLKRARAAFDGISPDAYDKLNVSEGSTVYRPIEETLLAVAAWLRENREEATQQ